MTVKTKPASPQDAIDPHKALVPVVHKTNEMRVKRDFWPKMRKVASKIPFADQALAAWYATQDPQTPFRAKALLLGALAYCLTQLYWRWWVSRQWKRRQNNRP